MLIERMIRDAARKARNLPASFVKDAAKTAATKLNPLDKPINKEDVMDSGMESLRLGYGTAKKGYQGIKTTTRTIKTTKRTIRTAKDVVKETGSTVYRTGKMVYRVARGTAKVVTVVGKAVGSAAVHVVAAAMNPLVLLIAVLLVIIIMTAALIVLLLGGASVASSNAQAYSGAVGLGDVPAQYQAGQNFFQIAVQNQRNGFDAIFDGMYYSDTDLGHSNLVYMERTKADDTLTCYQKAFANPTYRGILKNQWTFAVTETEAIAIAYVYLEKAQNTANGTTNQIYEVTFDQATFDTIVSKCVAYNDTVFTGQICPDSRCSRQIIYEENPDYAVALEKNNTAASAFNDWAEVAAKLYAHSQIDDGTGQANYWNSTIVPLINTWIVTYNRYPDETNCGYDFLAVLGAEYEAAAAVLNNTPPTIERIIYLCEYLHDLHSVGLYFYDKEDVMNALSFTDTEKQWVELTEIGFDNNPDIP